MSAGISAPFIRYPIGTSLLMAGILFVGLIYLYLDKLSNAFAGWGRSGNDRRNRDDTAYGPIKQAAE